MNISPILLNITNVQGTNKSNKKQVSFQGDNFINFNNKYSQIRKLLQNETYSFIYSGGNATLLGEGIGGETFRFTHPRLSNIVIKRNKTGYIDDYAKEYENLLSIPTQIVGGQEAIARAQYGGNYYLISTLVKGKSASMSNKYTDSHLRNLFTKMFELDKRGIYHGDLNGKNILLSSDGTVNFIDYQWTQQVQKMNFFDMQKSMKILLPKAEFPENAQMFEMASMPWYIDNLGSTAEKEKFLKSYLNAKAAYHENRFNYIKKITSSWAYSNELADIRKSLSFEKAKAQLYKNPDSDVLKLEMKKFQFLSDYRDAYAHVDPNLPNRNIIASPSSYLCSISSVQDFRQEVAKQLRFCTDATKRDYLRSMENYGKYWYGNLTSYTEDTFSYIMRMVQKRQAGGEEPHKFYINGRNPRIFTPNLDILTDLGTPYKPVYQSSLDTPSYSMINTVESMYETPIQRLDLYFDDTKSQHHIDKLKGVYKATRQSVVQNKTLDTLNAAELAVLKIREFRGYVKHNISSYQANSTLSTLLENSVNFTQRLFTSIFNGLKAVDARSIIVKGYEGMRNFKYNIR